MWKPGYEWTFRTEGPGGKGTFVAAVKREEVVDGVDYYVTTHGQYESYWRKSDLAFYMQKSQGERPRRRLRFPLRRLGRSELYVATSRQALWGARFGTPRRSSSGFDTGFQRLGDFEWRNLQLLNLSKLVSLV